MDNCISYGLFLLLHVELVNGMDLELNSELTVDCIDLIEVHDRHRNVDLGVALSHTLGFLELLMLLILVTQADIV